MTLYIGLMSGTSLDGVDGVLVDFGSAAGPPATVRAHRHEAFGDALRADLLALNQAGPDELHRAALAGNAVARHYASVVNALLFDSGTAGRDVRAVGAHGQTVRHRPGEFDGNGYTLQLLNGALLAESTGIDVVCDLRSRDVAAGGQGAPLAPGFHAAVFAAPGETRAVLNLGGIANLTLLPADGVVTGFDCGPANALLDAWCERHCGRAFDEGGAWAASGRILPDLLSGLLHEPWLDQTPPKSTGRDLFNGTWLESRLAQLATQPAAADVQATLAAFSVECVARHLQRNAPDTSALYVCGGGARNGFIMDSLAGRLPAIAVQSTATLGIPVDQVEGAAFAWLAMRFIEDVAGNLPAVTGAHGPRRLGSLWPAC
jgi:anhydro-N-acetylmuramic acid kinase